MIEMTAAFICRRYVLNDEDLSATFDLLDMDKDGQLSRSEICALLRTVKVEPTRREMDLIFSEIDSNDAGKIEKEAFVNYMRSPPIHRFTNVELHKYFNEMDSDQDGCITEDEFSAILSASANLKDEDIISELFRLTDTNQNGRITFNQFLQLVHE